MTQQWEETVRGWSKAAQEGDRQAQYLLGMAHFRGDGAALDREKAVFWFLKAAAQGLASAQYRLGLACASGDGTAKDLVQSFQ